MSRVARVVRSRVLSVAVVTTVAVGGVGSAAISSASAVTCTAPVAADDSYTVAFGKTLKVTAPGLLANDTGTSLLVEVSWGVPASNPTPSDDTSFFGNAAIRYGNPAGQPDRQGGFTYTPDPSTPFSGDDQFSYSVIDSCGNEGSATATITVVPTVVDSSYVARVNTPLSVTAAAGFLSKDLGVDPASMFYDSSSVHGGSVDDSFASDGSFVYTPPSNFVGADSFTYQVDDLNGDHTYQRTVHIQVQAPPGAPTGVHAAASAGQASLSWVAPATYGSPITGYTVSASPGGKSVTVHTTRATVSGLSPGKYTFKVRALSAIGAGASSAPSNLVTIGAVRSGYWMLGADGHVYAFGGAARLGSAPGAAVAIAPRRDGSGYWTTDATGRVSAFGTAAWHGGQPGLGAGEQVSTMSATPSGLGYWLFSNRGRAFAYGDARFFGDMSGTTLNGPIIASVATPTGRGYYMVASDGGVFSFGDARFHGSTGGLRLNQPVVGISPTADNRGYWLVATDGGVFAFDAPFRGSMAATPLNRPVNGLVQYGNGYLMVASDGGIFAFSNKPFAGSLGASPPSAPIIGVAAFAAS